MILFRAICAHTAILTIAYIITKILHARRTKDFFSVWQPVRQTFFAQLP